MVTIKFCQLSPKFPCTLSEACLTIGVMVQRRWTIWTKGGGAKKAGAPDCHCCCSLTFDQEQLIYLFLVPSSHDKKHILRQFPYITEVSSRNAIPTTGRRHTHTEMAQNLWLTLVTNSHLKCSYNFSSKKGTKGRLHSAKARVTYVALAIGKNIKSGKY